MSVPRPKRGLSGVQFLDTAAKLETFSFRHSSRFPKRYTFSLTADIQNNALKIYKNVAYANSVYPIGTDNVEKREKAINEVLIALYEMVDTISLADDLFGIPGNIMEEWMSLIDFEDKLLKGILKSDRRKLRDYLTEHGPVL